MGYIERTVQVYVAIWHSLVQSSELSLGAVFRSAGFLVDRDFTGIWALAEEDYFDGDIIPAKLVSSERSQFNAVQLKRACLPVSPRVRAG